MTKNIKKHYIDSYQTSVEEDNFRSLIECIRMCKRYHGDPLCAMAPFSMDRIEIHINTKCHLTDVDNTDPRPVYIEGDLLDDETYILLLEFLIAYFNKRLPRLGQETIDYDFRGGA